MCTTGRLDTKLRPGLLNVERLGIRFSDAALLPKGGLNTRSTNLHGRIHLPLTASER
jgi:hypothetical protein